MSGPTPAYAEVSVTPADFDAIVRELDQLRSRHRDELARQLRDARAFGSPADDDDVLAVLEEVSVDRAGIARLEELVRMAAVVDSAFDGCAALGCCNSDYLAVFWRSKLQFGVLEPISRYASVYNQTVKGFPNPLGRVSCRPFGDAAPCSANYRARVRLLDGPRAEVRQGHVRTAGAIGRTEARTRWPGSTEPDRRFASETALVGGLSSA